MSIQTKTHISPEEYLEIERKTEVRKEYLAGEMFAMGGATADHVAIVSNLVRYLGTPLRDKKCSVFSTDLRLRVTPTGLYTYPDVMVVCGKHSFLDDRRDTLLNPTVVFEVLSESTQAYDRGKKFEHYRTLDSLRECVLVDQAKPHVEQYVRQPDNKWLLSEYNSLGMTVDLPSIACSLPLAEVYHKVEFGQMGK
jgi:Uma2 family endonuclease